MLKSHKIAARIRARQAVCLGGEGTLVLTDDDDTRLHYPFAFRLDVTYALEHQLLNVSFEITNTGDEPLPASIGAASGQSLAVRRSCASNPGTAVPARWSSTANLQTSQA